MDEAYRIARCKDEFLIYGLDRAIFPHDLKVGYEDAYWWVAFDSEDAPVGYAGLRPSLQKEQAGYLCRVGVLPHARGNGLQKRFIRVRERFARKGGMIELRTDTAPFNIASMRSLIKTGYLPFMPEEEWGVDNAVYWRKVL